MIYEQTTVNSSGSPKGNTIPSTPSGLSKGPIIPISASGSTSGKFGELPLKVPRGENFNSDPIFTDDGFLLSDAVEAEDDLIESSSQRWQASEGTSALLNVCFVKSISGFDKRQIVRSCPRPDVDCVYTPTLDKFLPDLIPKCKAEDKALRKSQDLLSDLAGPLAMIYELVSQTREDTEQLDTFLILSFATKGLQLLDNVNCHLSNKRREHALSKIGQEYTFLPNEKLENNGKELFRQQFEQRLKQRSETAKAISAAGFSPKGKQSFQGALPRQGLGIGGVQPTTTGVHISEVNLTDHPEHLGEEAEQHQPRPRRSPKSSKGAVTLISRYAGKSSLVSISSKLFIGEIIALFYQSWQEITSDPWILETVTGYRIEYEDFSRQEYLPSPYVTAEER